MARPLWRRCKENIIAVAIPFIMSAAGASAAIGAAVGISAGMVSTLAAVAFQVTGINDKVNKAASKVFGEDLVQFANIAGSAYAMFNGGFDLGGGAEAAAATDAAGNLIPAPEVPATDWAAQGTDNMGALAEASQGVEATSFNLSDMASADGLKMDDGSFMPNTPTETTGTNLLDPTTAPGVDAKTTAAAKMPDDSNGLDATPVAPKATAEVPTAAAPKATASTATAQTAAGAQAQVPNATAAPKNLFDRILYNKDGALNERLVGGVLQGVGSAYSSAQQMAQRQKELDAANARKNSLAPGRFY